MLTTEKGESVLDLANAEISAELKATYQEALEEFNASRAGLSVKVNFEGLQRPASGSGSESVAMNAQNEYALNSARYFRTPMFFSYALLTSLSRHPFPWILPGDPALNFSAHLSRGDTLDTKQSNMPHYMQSRIGSNERVVAWTDVSVFNRIGLLSKAFAPSKAAAQQAQSQGFGFGALSSGPIGDVFGDAMDIDVEPPTKEQRQQAQSIKEAGILPKFSHIIRGPILDRIRSVMDVYALKPLHRFAALAFLTMPHGSLLAITEMIGKGISLPFNIWLWRIFSRHLMGNFLVLEGGIRSGANFYNGAKFNVAHDGDTDVWHTRAVITTDAFAINAQNHRIIRNVQPRLYLGQHDCSFIHSVDDTTDDKPTMRRPSIISTVVPKNTHVNACFPLSFIDAVPGQVIPGSRETLLVDPKGQHNPAARYYGVYLFGSLFEGHKAIKNFAATPVADDPVFAADSKQNNHIAFKGFSVRYDYLTEYFTRDDPGNGHRAARRLNAPGAKDYLNGSGDYLVEPLPISQFHLY